MFRRSGKFAVCLCGLLLLSGAAGFCHAGLFDDEEARKQIAAEKRRVDELSAEVRNQQQAVDARVAKVEEALKSQALLDLFTQIESLKSELNKLRGQVEVLNNSIENTVKRQRDMYLDLDTRVTRIEQQGGPGAAAAVAPGPAPATPSAPAGAAPASVATVAAPAPAPPAVAPAPAAQTPAAAAANTAAAAPADAAAETRIYEAAQAQRRLGNYQGAIAAFQNFIKQYPKSYLAPRAQYWIGDSYFNLREFRLAISSQQTLIKTYPESPSVPDAMLNIASSQIEMGETAVGKKSLEELASKFPISDAADKAKRRIAAMNAVAGAPAGKP
jgi:tol-pal system protein YbgF